MKKVNVITESNVDMRASGAFGVVRHYYIEPYSTQHNLSGDRVFDRIYSGLSLSRLMVPENAINKGRKATFYALKTDNKLIHFAATSSNEPANKIRLFFDILAYLVNKYLLLHVGFFVLWAFSGKWYAYLFPSANVTSEIVAVNTSSGFGLIQKMLLYSALILIFI